MPKRRSSLVSLTAQEAHNALAFLVHEGRVTAKAVERALGQREKLIREIRDRMIALGGAAADAFHQAENAGKPRRKTVSAATRAARKAQGQYMAAVRRLSKDAKKRVRVIREKSGVKSAITMAKKLAK